MRLFSSFSNLQQDVTTKKIVILSGGGGSVGKTCYINRLQHPNDPFISTYEVTAFSTETKIPVTVGASTVNFNFVDVSRYGFLDNDIRGADCAILMFDVTARITYKALDALYDRLTNTCGSGTPIVLVGNNRSDARRRVKSRHITLHRTFRRLPYVEMSVRDGTNILEPLILLACWFKMQPVQHQLRPLAKENLCLQAILGKQVDDAIRAATAKTRTSSCGYVFCCCFHSMYRSDTQRLLPKPFPVLGLKRLLGENISESAPVLLQMQTNSLNAAIYDNHELLLDLARKVTAANACENDDGKSCFCFSVPRSRWIAGCVFFMF